MEIELDASEMVEAIMDDDSALDTLIDKIAEHMAGRIDESTREAVSEGFDYHYDQYRLSWMRMMEAEANDLENATIDNACDHGQKVYRGMFAMVRQYILAHASEVREMLDLHNLNEAVTLAASNAVDQRVKSVWEGGGYTVDTRPIRGRIGEPEPAFQVARPTRNGDAFTPYE